MSEPQHTPGPWEVHDSQTSSGGFDVMTAEGYYVAQAFEMFGADDEDVTEANARLMASSPDYHAAAVALVARHNKKAKRVNFDLCGCEGCESFRPIIAKAIGDK